MSETIHPMEVTYIKRGYTSTPNPALVPTWRKDKQISWKLGILRANGIEATVIKGGGNWTIQLPHGGITVGSRYTEIWEALTYIQFGWGQAKREDKW